MLFLIRHESVELSHFKTKLHEEITLSSAAICQIVVALFQGVLFWQDSLNKFLAVAEELAVKGLTTLETNEVAPTYYEHDDDDDVHDVEQPPPPKRTSSAKKAKRQSLASTSKRKVDPDASDVALEVDLKRIKADPVTIL